MHSDVALPLMMETFDITWLLHDVCDTMELSPYKDSEEAKFPALAQFV